MLLRRTRWQLLIVLALAVACGLVIGRLLPPPVQVSALEWLDHPRALADFTLRSSDGHMTARGLHGQWHAVALGFTHCPDLCPTTLSELAALHAAVGAENLRVIFVSVDPLRDSPQQLAVYVQFYNENFIGLTGSDTQLRNLASSLGMDFRRDGPVDSPQISHSPTIALIGPDGLLRGRLRPGFDTQQAAREIRTRIGVDS